MPTRPTRARSVALLLVITPALGFRAPQLLPNRRSRTIVALYENDPWLTSGLSSPLSGPSIEALFRYGPVVFGTRCFDSGEYNASVRKLMERYPKISRALAEQEINMLIADGNAYMASQSDERQRSGPQEEELLPPVGLADKLLVVAWVAILFPAVGFLWSSYMATMGSADSFAATDQLLDQALDQADALL